MDWRRIFPSVFLLVSAGLLLWTMGLDTSHSFLGRQVHRLPLKETRAVALTFHGPLSEETAAPLLAQLRNHAARATFFLDPETIRRYRPLTMALQEQGHELGVLKLIDPKDLPRSVATLSGDISRAALEYEQSGHTGRFPIRVLGGASSLSVNLALLRLGWRNILFDVAGPDVAKEPGAGGGNILPGSIIALKLDSPDLLPANRGVLEQLHSAAYQVSTYSELLELHKNL